MPFILSHHPECAYFSSDYITVRGVKLCIGCTFVFSSAVLFVIIDIIWHVWSLFLVTHWELLLLLAVIELVYYAGFGKNIKSFKILSKISLGILYASVVLAIYHTNLPELIKWYVLFLTYMLMNASIIGIRLYKVTKTCKKCPMYKDYPLCDGFKQIMLRLEKDGFVEILERENVSQ